MPTSDRYQLGSFGIWLFVRSGELLFVILALVAIAGTKFLTEYWAIALVLALLLLSSFDAVGSIAYGYGNDQGIYYRRYLRMQFARWENIASVECSRLDFCRIVIHFKRGNYFHRRIVIAENPEVRVFLGQILGRELPKAVIWLRSHLTR